ncbi:MAG: DUF3307 domain-containing protein [Rhodobacteraceae bacterium]|nr:DUF3307 domain-containing protein [Paracoccaceae bacterium]
MTPLTVLALLAALQVKHLIADYALQSAWMVRNKGIYGHPGGLAHAGIHAGLTMVALVPFGLPVLMVLALAAAEFVIHYHIDWAKQRVTEPQNLTPADKMFWVLFGADQFLHQLTYLGLVWVLVAH